MICLYYEVCDNLKVDYIKVNRVSLLFISKLNLKRNRKFKKKKYIIKEKLNIYINNIFEIFKLK